MDYISKISIEEQHIICDIIGGSAFKDLFTKNSKEFNRIKPGFRVNTLTVEAALNTAKKAINITNSGLVRDFVNVWIKRIIGEINECINNYESSGKTHDEALPITLIDSFFVNNIALFFKLCDEEINDDQLLHIEKGIEKEKRIRSEKSDIEFKVKTLEEKIRELETELENSQQKYNDLYSEKELELSTHKLKISELSRKNEDLLEQLQNAEDKNSAISSEIIEEHQLLEFEDKVPPELPNFNSDEITSLCEVSVDYNGSVWLMRKADIDYRGKLSFYIKDESRPLLFDNRDKLFQKDGPATGGDYAIWNWHTVPNNNDPLKDYVYTTYNPHISAIEIIIVNSCICLDEVISILKTGLEMELHSKKIMFSISKGKGQYEGVLLSFKDFDNENGKIILVESAISAPVYEFSSSEIMKFDTGKMFYKTVYAGMPRKVMRLKSAIEVVKEVVLNSISWANYKTRGIAKAEYKCFKDLIGAIPSENIIEKIAATNHCSTSAANELLNQFISKTTDYLNDSCFEDDILVLALSTNDSLMNRAKSLIMDEWKAENSKLLNDAKGELDDVKEKINIANNELVSIQCSCSQIKAEAESFSLIIADKEKLASEVELAVANKIRNAKQDAADFIADMAFVSAHNNDLASQSRTSSTDHTASYEVIKQCIDVSKAEKHQKWKDVIDTVTFELEEAGVSSSNSIGLATYLCAAFIAKEPQVIVGPNAVNVIEAFNTAISGDNLGVLRCDGDFSCDLLTDIGKENEKIVIVNNIFSNKWIGNIADVFSKQDIMFFATHPFTEDIQVEPKSIYNYMLPIFTEFFVDKKASNNYRGGYFANDFVEYFPNSKIKRESKIVSSLNTNKLIKGKIQKIISIMRDLNSNITKDDEFIFGFLQYMYATADYVTINEAIKNNSYSISNELKADLKYILGETNE